MALGWELPDWFHPWLWLSGPTGAQRGGVRGAQRGRRAGAVRRQDRCQQLPLPGGGAGGGTRLQYPHLGWQHLQRPRWQGGARPGPSCSLAAALLALHSPEAADKGVALAEALAESVPEGLQRFLEAVGVG